MLKNKEVKGVLLLAVSSLLAGGVQAQGLGNSPYSRLGLGEFNANTGGVRQMGMGGVGLAAPNSTNVNELNPAMLYFTSRTSFEAGYTGQYKTVKNASSQNRTGSATLGYMALAVPLSTKWGAVVGLKPLSAVDYESNVVQAVVGATDGAQVLKQYQGTGGVSEAYFAQGIQLTKSLAIGGTASYIFGTVDETTGTAIQTGSGSTSTKVVERDHTRYSDFAFRAAAHYRQKVNEKLFVNAAGVYSFGTNLRGDRRTTQERQDINGAILGQPIETVNGPGSSVLPSLWQAGLSIDNGRNVSVSLDVARQEWSKFQSFGARDFALDNTFRAGLGTEIVPDPGSVEHYFRRVSYRAGISMAQLPYRPGGQTLYDRAVSWGFGFPLPTGSPLEATTLSLAFTYGIRGNTDRLSSGSSNVQETYIKGQLGVTLNNRWFIKRRLQ
ncbi:membrane protein [Hymenobacter saemangeumensis]|uniref:Membrane protein n=1 Tax=Hymenobacter saemangeumensis TaxID=1084522 RepID=A0ABP8I513_9BACT